MKILFFDTETTGLPPKGYKLNEDTVHLYPHLIQLGYQLYEDENLLGESGFIVSPNEDFEISESAFNAHGISKESVLKEGVHPAEALHGFFELVKGVDVVICHNYWFDSMLIEAECLRLGIENLLPYRGHLCTMEATTGLLKIPSPYYKRKFKFPKLLELHQWLFGEDFEGAHDALNDVKATAKCYFELKKRNLI